MIKWLQKFINYYLLPGPIDLGKIDSMYNDMDFERCVDFVLAREGGYTNNKNDSGGETNFGISKRAFPNENIRAITRGRAKTIYKKSYWEAAGCDSLSWPMNLIVFDTAVNMGVGAAKELLIKTSDETTYLNARVEFYKALARKKPKNLIFLKGWLNRISELRKEAGLT